MKMPIGLQVWRRMIILPLSVGFKSQCFAIMSILSDFSLQTEHLVHPTLATSTMQNITACL